MGYMYSAIPNRCVHFYTYHSQEQQGCNLHRITTLEFDFCDDRFFQSLWMFVVSIIIRLALLKFIEYSHLFVIRPRPYMDRASRTSKALHGYGLVTLACTHRLNRVAVQLFGFPLTINLPCGFAVLPEKRFNVT